MKLIITKITHKLKKQVEDASDAAGLRHSSQTKTGMRGEYQGPAMGRGGRGDCGSIKYRCGAWHWDRF